MRRGNIVLVGFMGTGKSTVAKKISGDLKMEYVDTDSLIESKEGRSINDIFSENGEDYFRTVEREVIKEVSAKTGCVIDAGGGVVLNANNMRDLKSGGIIFCLTATAGSIYERTRGHGHRPLLNVEDPVGRINELLKKREKFYMAADHQISTDDRTAADVAGEIEKIYKREK